MSEENEYEVEYVIRAKVQNKRKNKISWKYLVKWKGYSLEDNTWEPATSFDDGPNNILMQFWDRVNTNGRDINDASLFKSGEELYPQGPPRKVKRVAIEAPEEREGSPPPPGPSEAEAAAVSNSEKETKKSGKRRRSSLKAPEETEEPAEKRKRVRSLKNEASNSAIKPTEKTLSEVIVEANSTMKKITSRRGRPPGLKVLPTRLEPSDDEMLLNGSLSEDTQNNPPMSPPVVKARNGKSASPNTVEDSEVEDQPDQDDFNDPLFDSPESTAQALDSPPHRPARVNITPSTPSHRARAANPLVKAIDDPNFMSGMDGAIKTKARLLARKEGGANGESSKAGSSSRSSKPGPGRSSLPKSSSSLLTFDKGALKTVKGKFRPTTNTRSPSNVNGGDDEMEVDAIMTLDMSSETGPVTGQELLHVAGLNEDDVEALPDFEDNAPGELARDSQEGIQAPQEVVVVSNSLAQAVGNLFPAQSSSSLFGGFNVPWKRSSIFDPIGFGTSARHATSQNENSNGSSMSIRPTFSLSLDSAVAVPIVLKDLYQTPDVAALDNIFAANPRGPPGKFYREEIAKTLVNTLRSGGSSARVEVEDDGNENQKQHFERFRSRLEAGEMFVGLAGHEVLAFCSSSNATVGQKLGAPEMLLGLAEIVVVSRVVIENHSAYADVACQAEHVRW